MENQPWKRQTMALALLVGASMMLLSQSASADEVAYHCNVGNANGYDVKPLTQRGACTGVELRHGDGKLIRTIRGQFAGSGDILVSQDGRTVVFVQSNPYADMARDGTIKVVDKGGDAQKHALGVVFVRDGKRIATHRLTELLGRPTLVTATSSHIRWLVGDRPYNQPLVDILTLETTSMKRLVFDLNTGALQSSKDTGAWTSCDAIAYGEVKKRAGERAYAVEPAWPIKDHGIVKKKAVAFTIKNRNGLKVGAYQMVCFKRVGSRLMLVRATNTPMLNAVTFF
ncbi:MAG: hypothetical protein AAFX99_00685 [Myxococcota bacterium]